MTRSGLILLFALLAVVVAISTIFFRLVEGWSWLEAYFFTVVTLSTVGYGNIVPTTPAGMIGTTVLIFVGLGIFAAAIQQLSHFTIHRRSAFRRRRREAQAAERERVEGDA